MTTETADRLQRLARRLQAASLAVSALGDTPDVDAAAELVLDVAAELAAVSDRPVPVLR